MVVVLIVPFVVVDTLVIMLLDVRIGLSALLWYVPWEPPSISNSVGYATWLYYRNGNNAWTKEPLAG